MIDPSVRREKWTTEEEIQILDLWLQLGSQWHKIAKQLEGRTEIQAKNKFKCILKKAGVSVETGANGGPL